MSIIADWDLEERVEDAIVAYLKNECTDVAMIIPSRTITTASFPLIIVDAGDSDNHTDTARFTGRRIMDVTIAMFTEALNLNGDDGSETVLQTAREHHRIIKSSILQSLAGNTLHTDLNNLSPEGVAFSLCTMGLQAREAGDGKLMTVQTMTTIAQPKEL